jgi:CubicO group peptidase (beta-lactamase class C family)
LTLVDEGLLDLDRPVAEYLDWGDYHPGVTMRHLLSMMSGIPSPSSGQGTWFEDPCVADAATTLEECARGIFQDGSRSIPPGQEFRYSAAAWQLAGAVAELVSKRSWAELVEQRLASPCGLGGTGYGNIPIDSYPNDFNGDPASLAETANPNLGGGAYSTVNDYSKVLLMHLHNGLCGPVRVLSEASVQAMQADLVPEGVTMPIWRLEAINYGMGWWKYDEEEYPEARGLLIDSGAFGARAYLHPEDGWAAIVILESKSQDGRELRETLVPAIKSAVAEADIDAR